MKPLNGSQLLLCFLYLVFQFLFIVMSKLLNEYCRDRGEENTTPAMIFRETV